MAHVIKEFKFGSREGSVRGAGGVMDRRTFRVTLDITDDEFNEDRYPDPRGVVELYKVRYGSPSPWNRYARALHYELGERIGNKTWKVTVVYEIGGVAAAPTMEAAWHRWTVSIRGAATTQQIVEEPADALEGWINAGKLPAREPKLIGTPYFSPVKEGPYTARVSRFTPEGRLESYDQAYQMTPARVPRPYTEDVPALTYTQTRLFANFNFERVGYIAEYYKRVNRFKYLGAQPAHLKFMDFTLDEIPHLIGDGSIQLDPGIAYRASLVFLFSAKAFAPLRLVATVRDDLGNEAPVYRTDGDDLVKVVDDNWVVAGMNFNTLLRIVMGGRVGERPGRRGRR